ncbi:alpha/beta fold hydrolase [Kineococcus sp. SYSU DK005]|uniref:alpha/beta fold hydrolase n=1 Tax=Kineococcus sp. SYSU DK005 TaxID=3383126 RepID=UPI003D7CC91E
MRRRERVPGRRVEVDGLRVHYREAAWAPPGSPVVVAVHGLGLSATSMLPLARELAPRHRVLVPDLPGHGRSQRPPREPGVAELSDLLARFAQRLGVRRAAFLGGSIGAQVVMNLAVRHRELARALVLVGPTHDPGAPSPWQQAVRVLRDAARERWTLTPLAAASYLDAGPGRMWRLLEDALRQSHEGLQRLEVPTLVVRGERDPVATQPWAERIAHLAPEADLHVVPGAAHAPNWSRPRELAAVVEAFLSRTGAA